MIQMNCMYRTLLAAVALAVASVTASAETITVCADGCDYTSINAAIGAASNGDVIQLAAETYFEGDQIDTLGKAITLRGVLDKAGEPASVLDGAGTHRVIQSIGNGATLIAFEMLHIQNGSVVLNKASSAGGGVRVEDSDVKFVSCHFVGNSTGNCGGAVWASNCDAEFDDCYFFNNQPVNGCRGVLHWAAGSPVDPDGFPLGVARNLTVTNCEFLQNSAGAIAANGASYDEFDLDRVVISDSSFTENGLGGIISSSTYSLEILRCSFVGNGGSSLSRGGGVYIYGSQGLQISNSVFLNNTAQRGGGIWSSAPTSTFNSVAIRDNTSLLDPSGGALFSGGLIPTLTDTSFCGNSPGQFAGAWTDGGGNCVRDACCPGDINCDYLIDATDLGALLASWGSFDAIVDRNGDGFVGGADLAYVLSYWGASCN